MTIKIEAVYVWHNKDVAGVCFYCGCPGDSVDHTPPTSARQSLIDSGVASRFRFIIVHACRECNSLLGACSIWDVAKRKKYIKNTLRKRYKRYLNIPNWSDSELGRLGPTMQRHVIAGLREKELIEDRINY